jgi:hypothetical protein
MYQKEIRSFLSYSTFKGLICYKSSYFIKNVLYLVTFKKIKYQSKFKKEGEEIKRR